MSELEQESYVEILHTELEEKNSVIRTMDGEIDRLRAENARLRQAHSEMLTFMKEVQQALPSIFRDKARAILSRVDVMIASVPPVSDPKQQKPS